MKTLTFRNGDSMPILGLGTWKATGNDVKDAVKKAVQMGYRHIDTAAIYGNEKEIGEALSELFSEGTVQREDLFITTKLWNDAHHPDDVIPALKASLQKLGLTYIDLYLIHWPVAFKKGTSMPKIASDFIPLSIIPIEATWAMMEEAKEQGFAKHIGVSNFSIQKLKRLLQKCEEAPEVNQVEMHPLLQQESLYQFCKEHQILLTAYSPLGSGDRSAQMKADEEPNLFDIPEIQNIAEKHEAHPAQVLINWHVQRGVSVIPKATTPSHIESNLNAATLDLTLNDLKTITPLDRNYRYITGKFFDMPKKGYQNVYDE